VEQDKKIVALRHKSRLWVFKQAILLEFKREAGQWVCQMADWPILGRGATPQEARKAMSEYFALAWDSVMPIPLDKLSGEGAKLKRRLENVVAEVQDGA